LYFYGGLSLLLLWGGGWGLSWSWGGLLWFFLLGWGGWSWLLGSGGWCLLGVGGLLWFFLLGWGWWLSGNWAVGVGTVLLLPIDLQFNVFGKGLLVLLDTLKSGGSVDSLSSESFGSDESLDLWSLGSWLLSFLSDGSSNNVSSDIIVLLEVVEFSDLVGSLWTQSSWDGFVGQTSDVLLALLHDNEGKDSEISTDNAASD